MADAEDMGKVYAEVCFIGPDGRRYEARLLVDTGSTYTWIRTSTLERLGVKPRQGRRRRFPTIEGKKIQRQLGDIAVEFEGDRGMTAVVFAGARDVEVLGLHALETLGLEVDPAAKTLRRSDAILAV